ncbi:fructose-specific PTS transporter subunit EIIC [Gulosibacter sediminis]|uniref:fructose-specific PTS transporter subunit EIIC n=1 Tax=Gulosibacter sediminis TaxID=1729695 RepID=UPI0024AD7B84|nr:fructose-specific PTS transporter subunit EIIC [Gulosibacter sediminis]
MTDQYIIAATGCPTGVAHTFMAEEAIIQAAKARGIEVKVETHGQAGVEHALTADDIRRATAVIVAADKDVQAERFVGKPLVNVSVAAGIHKADQLIDQALAKASAGERAAAGEGESESALDADLLDVKSIETTGTGWRRVGRDIYKSLMNGVSHMLPFVVAGGVLIAVSFLWGIYSADPESDQFNQFAANLKEIGGIAMGLMVPVLSAFISDAIAKRPGLVVGFITGLIASTYGTGFLGGIVTGFLSGYGMLLLDAALKWTPKSLNGLKAIFLFPVIGTAVFGLITLVIATPMASISTNLESWLSSFQDANPLLLGLILGIMSAFDMGGPVNKAAYVTGVALLGDGNITFMAAVSAACIAPPLVTAIAATFFPKGFQPAERRAGYVNYILGATHITEGAIPFAARSPLVVIPILMLSSSIAAILSLLWGAGSPAPHGGFLVLPVVTNPLLWVAAILIGSVVGGVIFGLYRTASARRAAAHAASEHADVDEAPAAPAAETPITPASAAAPGAGTATATATATRIFAPEHVRVDVDASGRDGLLQQVAATAQHLGMTTDPDAVVAGMLEREAQSTTALAQGVSIPHVKSPAVTEAAILIVRGAQPVTWTDGELVSTALAILVPAAEAGSTHLELLAKVARGLMDDEFRETLISGNVDAIYQRVDAQLNS